MSKANTIAIGLLFVLVLLGVGSFVVNSNDSQTQEHTDANPDKPAMAEFAAQKTNWKSVEQIIGKTGEMKEGDVFYFGLPRTDLEVTLKGVQLKPAFALGSWVAFKPINNEETMVMGDLVLREEEVTPVMSRLISGGINVTSLHNHLMGESPSIMYVHIEGYGNPTELAKTLRSGIEQSNTPIKAAGPSVKEEFSLDKEQLDHIFGKEGSVSNGVYKISFPRPEQIKENGMVIPPSMGTSTAINFQPTSGEKAAITGDFVLTAEEVNPVIRVLRNHDIEVEAVHNHMLFEEPRLFFVHFWANDDAEKLAKGLLEAIKKNEYKIK